MRKDARPSPAFPYWKRQKAGRGLGTRLEELKVDYAVWLGWHTTTTELDHAVKPYSPIVTVTLPHEKWSCYLYCCLLHVHPGILFTEGPDTNVS